MPTLHELTDALLRELAAIDPETGEVSGSLDTVIADFGDKVEACAHARLRLLADADACEAMAKHYDDRCQAAHRRSERLDAYVLGCMQVADQRKVERPTATVWLQESRSVLVEDATKLPLRLFRVPEPPPPAPDKKAIKAELDSGNAVPGASIKVTTTVRYK